MPRQPFGDIACSIARATGIIGERWTPLIVRDLFAGMTRFEDLRRDLGIATNVLSTRLETLERNGIVERREYRSAPVRHEYVLTAKGYDLYPVIAAILAWGDKWAAPDGPPALITHTDCGRHTSARMVCAECGGELNHENTYATAGPGARPGPGTALIGEFLTDPRNSSTTRT
ncbi:MULTISPECIES: helix-turn-helix domain-containing protein [unclassified Nocardia]|uniref:winged helix-turn-helix transcriptional regulator n=1 Tax=unclassified Nocardia TaxID=2637762 RepID=UPI001CE3DEB5|nr:MULTISPECIES: helix-turn-helix domain-containing protein [unclassified Nocardia]